MINNVEIANFKSIKDKATIDFGKLNLILGTNSSGKTSILQCILLLAQRGYSDDILNGCALSLGTFRNIKNFDSEPEERVQLSASNNENRIVISEVNNELKILDDSLGDKFKYNIDVHYLPAERVGIKDLYNRNVPFTDSNNLCEVIICKLSKIENKKFTASGFKPINTQGMVKNFDFNLINYISFDSSLRKDTISDLLNVWFESLTGYRYKIETIPDSDYIHLYFYKNDVANKLIRPQHVGTGVTYIFIQIALGFITNIGDIVLVENPELHLHPKLQSNITHFYSWLSNNGRQVIIESHSDHVFNAFRIQNMLNPEVFVSFCSQDTLETNYFPSTIVNRIIFGDYGVIRNDFEGLNDQFEIDLEKILVLGDED